VVGEGFLVDGQAEIGRRGDVAGGWAEFQTKTLLIAAGEKCSTAGAADGGGDIAIGEANAGVGDGIDVGCAKVGCTLDAQIVVARSSARMRTMLGRLEGVESCGVAPHAARALALAMEARKLRRVRSGAVIKVREVF